MTKYMWNFYTEELEKTKNLLATTEEHLDNRGKHIYEDRIRTFHEKLDEEVLIRDIDEQIQEFDVNNDGYVTFAEWRSAYERWMETKKKNKYTNKKYTEYTNRGNEETHSI